jgi:hypothetical protein
VRKLNTPSGPFAFRLYFEDLGEIDEICLEALTSQSLLPSEPAPIRIDRFVEKQFKAPLRYEDLGPEHLGCTIFNSSGAVEAILVSRLLEEQNTTPARRRVRSTIAHEAGHGLLHGPLFVEGDSPHSVSDGLGEKQPLILCRSEDILVDALRAYTGRWWEFQANQAMGSLLLPSALINAFLKRSGIEPSSFASHVVTPPEREAIVKKAAVIFDVNPIVVRIRLDSLFPRKKNKKVQL